MTWFSSMCNYTLSAKLEKMATSKNHDFFKFGDKHRAMRNLNRSTCRKYHCQSSGPDKMCSLLVLLGNLNLLVLRAYSSIHIWCLWCGSHVGPLEEGSEINLVSAYALGAYLFRLPGVCRLWGFSKPRLLQIWRKTPMRNLDRSMYRQYHCQSSGPDQMCCLLVLPGNLTLLVLLA
jgi:hypothetical protein